MAAKALKKRGARMAVASPQPFVHEILKVAAVDSVVPIYDDVPAACVAMGPTDTLDDAKIGAGACRSSTAFPTPAGTGATTAEIVWCCSSVRQMEIDAPRVEATE